MNNDIYDILKMQRDDAEKLVLSESARLEESQAFNQEARSALEQSKITMVENLAFLKSLGISLDDDLSKARQQAHMDADAVVEEINKSTSILSTHNVSYEDLVALAHSRGYLDTKLQELLTEEEINTADQQFRSIEAEFQTKTKLSKTDVTFLITAIALQVIRQYVLDPMLKNRRPNAGANDERFHGHQTSGWYRVPTDKILSNTVPFDAIRRSSNRTIQDFLKGQKNHRDATLGHDPILGWIFGTANIMTGTITNCTFNSAHVKYVPGKGNVIHSKADTLKIFTTIMDRVSNEGFDGKKALAFALLREGIHLKSDLGTTHSLPLPGVNVLCPEFGAKLLEYGINTASVGSEAALATLINMIISMVHRMIKPESENEKMYTVRTRKILLLSNAIASASNLIAVGIAAGVGVVGENPDLVKKSVSYLDVGGLIVTITRLFTDIRFISKVKEEFINSKLDEQLNEMLNSLDNYLAD